MRAKKKKQILTYLKKNNEGDEKNKQNENIAGKMFFIIFRNKLGFFRNVFYLFYFGNRQQFNARAGQKKHVFFGNARPKSNARAHLKQRKNNSGLRNGI